MLPIARFVGSGVILPSSAGLTLPIETYNLKQVIVEAKQVFDNNMPQFLQVNTLNEKNELTRVGRVVWRKWLTRRYTPDKQNRWVRYGLDMTPLTQNFPGGLYVISLSFQRPACVRVSMPGRARNDGGRAAGTQRRLGSCDKRA